VELCSVHSHKSMWMCDKYEKMLLQRNPLVFTGYKMVGRKIPPHWSMQLFWSYCRCEREKIPGCIPSLPPPPDTQEVQLAEICATSLLFTAVYFHFYSEPVLWIRNDFFRIQNDFCRSGSGFTALHWTQSTLRCRMRTKMYSDHITTGWLYVQCNYVFYWLNYLNYSTIRCKVHLQFLQSAFSMRIKETF
jgi:hypothetical protein